MSDATHAHCIVCENLVEARPRWSTEQPPDCGRCGEFMVWVAVSECDLGRECEHDDHHFGHNVHVKEIE